MALPARQQVIVWGAAAGLAGAALWGLGDVILPFVTGAAVAYFLDPVADRLERAGLSRVQATTLITLIAALVVILAALWLVPMLIGQAVALAEALPDLLALVSQGVQARLPEEFGSDPAVGQALTDLGALLRQKALGLVNLVAASAAGVVSFFLFILVVPVVAFYLLLDWDRLLAELDRLLPRDHAPVIRRLALDVDAVLSGFVRGQVSVCIVLAIFYAGGLMLAGLQFGMVVGVVTGLISFIPYVGAIVGGVLSLGLALVQFWGQPGMILAIAALFALGQFLEGNVLVPRLVGKSVGLHPVWLLLALSVFGALFGFVGMLVAVPVAAAIGVLARFATGRYVQSRLYTGRWGADGLSGSADEPAPEAHPRSGPDPGEDARR
jgi:predicted PurR-regulated permease PerM